MLGYSALHTASDQQRKRTAQCTHKAAPPDRQRTAVPSAHTAAGCFQLQPPHRHTDYHTTPLSWLSAQLCASMETGVSQKKSRERERGRDVRNWVTFNYAQMYVFVMLSILQSQFAEKGFKKTENSKQNVVLLLFSFTLGGGGRGGRDREKNKNNSEFEKESTHACGSHCLPVCLHLGSPGSLLVCQPVR